MIALLLALGGGLCTALAFPRFGPGLLVLPGIAMFLAALRRAGGKGRGALVGAVYGLSFFGGLLWWISELGLIAVAPLVVVQAGFSVLYGWWLGGQDRDPPLRWAILAVGGWAIMEMVRYRFPFNGFEWGGAGYGLSEYVWAREAAWWIGTSGLTMLVVVTAAMLVLLPLRKAVVGAAAMLVLMAASPSDTGEAVGGDALSVVIVQGSTPCPYEHCGIDERFLTYLQHLELTRTIPAGSADLVVWSEGSTGAHNADPVQNLEIGEAMAAEARRIGAWFLVGSDRPTSETHWVNANVVFDPEGRIVGEYRKQHPVPFGEYIPFRPLFEWIPDLSQVPRDMIPGAGPVLFEVAGTRIGSVISFEGSFARYARQHVVAGAEVIVVATNEGSYGTTPGSDQLIGMTRMRAAELGVPVIHAAVTGKSAIIDADGRVKGITGLATRETLYGSVTPGAASVYARIGDVMMLLLGVTGLAAWLRLRRR